MTLFDFLNTENGREIIRLLEGVVTIVAAVLSGNAARSARQAREMIGGKVGRTAYQWAAGLFRRPRHGRSTVVPQMRDEPLTLDQKIDLLQQTQERMWTNQGRAIHELARTLDNIAPPSGRRRGEPEDD